MEIIGYQIIDKQTREVVSKVYSYAQRNRARVRADKLDNNYGAYRYIVKPLFDYTIEDLNSKGFIDTGQVLFLSGLGIIAVILIAVSIIF